MLVVALRPQSVILDVQVLVVGQHQPPQQQYLTAILYAVTRDIQQVQAIAILMIIVMAYAVLQLVIMALLKKLDQVAASLVHVSDLLFVVQLMGNVYLDAVILAVQ